MTCRHKYCYHCPPNPETEARLRRVEQFERATGLWSIAFPDPRPPVLEGIPRGWCDHVTLWTDGDTLYALTEPYHVRGDPHQHGLVHIQVPAPLGPYGGCYSPDPMPNLARCHGYSRNRRIARSSRQSRQDSGRRRGTRLHGMRSDFVEETTSLLEQYRSRGVEPDNIPKLIKERARWIIWKAFKEKPDGRFDKVPVHPKTGQMMNAQDPNNQLSYKQAYSAYTSGVGDGIGIVLTGDPITQNEQGEDLYLIGMDLDNIQDDMGEAKSTAESLRSYPPYL